MKKVFFDSGPIVTLALTDLLGVLKKLKEKSDIEFYITQKVRREVVEKPMTTRQFKFEAIRILRLIEAGILKVYDHPALEEKTQEFIHLANKIFYAKDQNIEIVHFGEMQTLAAAIIDKADCVVIDERTTRLLVEEPTSIGYRLEKKLHTKVNYDKKDIERMSSLLTDIKVLRSTELLVFAYEKGLLNDFILNIKNPKRELLDGILWALKLSGCSISEDEIEEIIKIEEKTF